MTEKFTKKKLLLILLRITSFFYHKFLKVLPLGIHLLVCVLGVKYNWHSKFKVFIDDWRCYTQKFWNLIFEDILLFYNISLEDRQYDLVTLIALLLMPVINNIVFKGVGDKIVDFMLNVMSINEIILELINIKKNKINKYIGNKYIGYGCATILIYYFLISDFNSFRGIIEPAFLGIKLSIVILFVFWFFSGLDEEKHPIEIKPRVSDRLSGRSKVRYRVKMSTRQQIAIFMWMALISRFITYIFGDLHETALGGWIAFILWPIFYMSLWGEVFLTFMLNIIAVPGKLILANFGFTNELIHSGFWYNVFFAFFFISFSSLIFLHTTKANKSLPKAFIIGLMTS
jgi:hypothetical protein